MTLLKCLLQRVQSLRQVDTFERQDLSSIHLHRQKGAGASCLAIDYDRARSACPFSASDLYSGEAEAITQEITEQKPIGYGGADLLAVHSQFETCV